MSQLRTLIRAARIKGRVCPKCQALMMLCDITPARLNFEQHTFKCVDCDHVVVVMVEDCKSAAVCTENLNPDVVMMKSAEYRV